MQSGGGGFRDGFYVFRHDARRQRQDEQLTPDGTGIFFRGVPGLDKRQRVQAVDLWGFGAQP